MLKKRELIVLCIVVLLAFFLRAYQINSIPPAAVADEASVFYNALTVVRSLRDEWGTVMPTVFSAFGDYKSPLYIYTTAVIMKIVGPGLISLKLTHIVVSSLLCILTYFFIRILTRGSFMPAGLSCIIALFLPWGLFFARIADDGIMLYSVLLMAGFLFGIHSIKRKSIYQLLLALVLFVASYFSYNAGRVTTPLAMLSVVVIYFYAHHGSYTRQHIIKGVGSAVVLIFCLLLISGARTGINNRLSYVGIFGTEKPTQKLIQQHRSEDKNSFLSKILHNKLSGYSYTLIRNYASHFSPSFLLFDKQQTNMNESPFAPLNPVTGIGYFVGVIYLIRQAVKSRGVARYSAVLMLVWIVISPLPSTITDAPSSKRYLGALGTFPVVCALGLFAILNTIATRYGKLVYQYSVGVVSILIMTFGILFVYRYFTQYPKEYGHLFAVRQNYVGRNIADSYNRFGRFYMSHELDGRPYIFPLFYLQTDPARFAETRSHEEIDGWFRINSFEKISFPQTLCDANTQKKLFEQLPVRIYATENEKNCLGNILNVEPFDVTYDLRKAYALTKSDRLYYFDILK